MGKIIKRISMPHLISNMVEKAWTPYTARMAPRNLWSRPALGRKPQKVTRFGASPKVKAFWRFIRSWVCHNHKLYYTYVIFCGMATYNLVWAASIGYYRWRNRERSLEWAIEQEKLWEINKPKEEEYDDEDYGDEAAGGEAAEAAGEAEAAEDGDEEDDE